MANNTTMSGRFVEITLDGTTDWLWSQDLTSPFNNPAGIHVRCIQFQPSAANDVMVIRNGGVDAAAIFRVKCADTTDDRPRGYNPEAPMRPVIDASDITLGTAANARVYIELE